MGSSFLFLAQDRSSAARRYAPAAMKKADKLARIRQVLDERVPDVPIPLDHVDPFTLLVAVVL
jgi:hypothetical protein